MGVCKTRNRPGTPLDRLENPGAPSSCGGVPGLFLVLQTSFQSEATEYYNTKRQNMINKSRDILFSNELESELGLTLRSHEGAMYDGEQIHARTLFPLSFSKPLTPGKTKQKSCQRSLLKSPTFSSQAQQRQNVIT